MTRPRMPIVALLLSWVLTTAAAQDLRQSKLEEELRRLALTAGGTVGVAAVHLPSGRSAKVQASQRFPMASTYKVAIAVALLQRVEREELSLQDRFEVRPGDLRPGSGTLSVHFSHPGVALSLENLLELMLVLSDNTATDLLLREAGGPEAVSGVLRQLEIEEMRVDRPTLQLIADWAGVDLPRAAVGKADAEAFIELFEAVTPQHRQEAARAFLNDPRDTATPEAMVRLLMLIRQGQALNPDHSALLLDVMKRCETGPGRIRGLLPPYVETAHKTGTIGSVTNDVGLLTLPDEGGEVALAVFIKDSPLELAAREAAIAQMARAVYDYFLFTAEGPEGAQQADDSQNSVRPPGR